MKRHIIITLCSCSAIREKKELNDAQYVSSTVEDIFHFIHLRFLTESSPDCHLVNLCYVGSMKWSISENNGFCVYWEEGKQVAKVYIKGAVKMPLRVTE